MAPLALMLSACILLLASARAIRHFLTKVIVPIHDMLALPSNFSLQTRHVPSMGSVVPILSYLEAIRFLVDAPTILCQGYAKVILYSVCIDLNLTSAPRLTVQRQHFQDSPVERLVIYRFRE